MRKKFITWLLVCLCVGLLALGAACNRVGRDDDSSASGSKESVHSGISSSTPDEDGLSDEISSSMPDPVLPGPDTYERLSDGTINFGAYPQTKVTDETLTTALNAEAGTLPTASNSQSWTSYKYYIESSNDTDFMWYQDVDYGENTYRGVYFDQYRPSFMENSSSAGHSSQDENGYTTSTVYWFEWETLNWTVLAEDDGKAFLLCNSIIDSQEYYDNYSDRTINGVTVDANNYAESNIRKWLNETFYETAFTSLQQGLIATTEVDNSAKSTNPYGQPTYWDNGINDYACENTYDKIFLLSEEEITNTNYGFSSDPGTCDTVRYRKSSDYAQSQGCGGYKGAGSSYDGNGYWWWLRSPYCIDDDCARGVGYDGTARGNCGVCFTFGGVVPALKITL